MFVTRLPVWAQETQPVGALSQARRSATGFATPSLTFCAGVWAFKRCGRAYKPRLASGKARSRLGKRSHVRSRLGNEARRGLQPRRLRFVQGVWVSNVAVGLANPDRLRARPSRAWESAPTPGCGWERSATGFATPSLAFCAGGVGFKRCGRACKPRPASGKARSRLGKRSHMPSKRPAHFTQNTSPRGVNGSRLPSGSRNAWSKGMSRLSSQ